MERSVDREKERAEWLRIHEESVKEIRSVLKRYEYNVQEHLAEIVASFCGVETDAIFSKKRLDMDKIQARWLFLYAYRYMTGKTYKGVVKTLREMGMKMSVRGVALSINNMSKLIETDHGWRCKWTVLKGIIKEKEDVLGNLRTIDVTEKCRITITVPDEFKDIIKVEVK